jgi:alkanesulfonate monooxygenase SsuD/methylene tetrahydromethanopterin reductase-like flavin-dependent oxidoreductase (luciferase family)
MRIGISLASAHANADVREGARWMSERAAAANAAGLDSLFIGDHHATPMPYYQNTPMLGRLLAEWGDRPAGCLFLLPLWNPVLLAEQVGTLASIMQGRFILQCALGAGHQQFAAMGANMRHRPSLFEEGFDILKRLLAGESVTSAGRYQIPATRIAPVPPEPVEYWIGGSAEPSIDRAARLGDAWLAGPELTPGEARHWAAYYLQRCAAYGRTPTCVAIRRDVYVGEDSGDAHRVADPIMAGGYRGHDPSAATFGSVEEVAARFAEYGSMGYTDIIVRHLTDDQPTVLGSIARLKAVQSAIARG